jgi:UPF0755 protein
MTVAALVALLVLIVAFLFRSPTNYPAGHPGADVTVVVNNGESGSAIATSLARAGVIKSSKVLVSELLANPSGISIAPGSHKLQLHIPAKLALAELLDLKRIENVIVVRDAATSSTVLSEVHHDSKLKQSDALSTLQFPIPNPQHSLEGQLAPAQYSFAPGTSTHEALQVMLNAGGVNIKASGIELGYKKLTPYQLLIIASLIQIEADPADYQRVAQVIYNRLAINMPLQLNSTVAYAQGLQGQIGLSTAATRVASPFNTYLHTGLPPTPICNPTPAALAATLHPMSGNWLYFITVKPHETRFTASFAQFETWVALYNHNVALGAFK